MTEVVLGTDAAKRTSVCPRGLIIPIHPAVEVRFHLEQLRKLTVVPVQHVVVEVLANQNHLCLQRNRFRQNGLHRQEAQPLCHLFYNDLAFTEAPRQSVPRHQLLSNVLHPDHQVPAIGPMDGAGANHSEIAGESPKLSLLLHATDEVIEGRHHLCDDRSALNIRVVHQDIHLVLLEGIRKSPGGERVALGSLGRRAEEIPVLDDVVPHRLQVLRNAERIAVLPFHFLDESLQDELDHLTVDLLYLLFDLPIPASHLGHRLLDAPLDTLLAFRQAFLLFGAQRQDFLFTKRFAIHQRNQQDTHARHLDGETTVVGQLVELIEEPLPVLVEGPGGSLSPLAVVLALKRLPYVRLRGLNQSSHVPLKLHRLAGIQLQCLRSVRVVEVVDVAPIGRGVFVLGYTLEKGSDGCHLASARQTSGIYIETGVLYLQPELKSFQRPVLSDYG